MRNESSSYQTATWTAVVWALGVLIVGSYAPWASALEMYLEIDNVKGEVTADGHVDAIEVLAWSWGVKSSVSVTPGQPRKLGPRRSRTYRRQSTKTSRLRRYFWGCSGAIGSRARRCSS